MNSEYKDYRDDPYHFIREITPEIREFLEKIEHIPKMHPERPAWEKMNTQQKLFYVFVLMREDSRRAHGATNMQSDYIHTLQLAIGRAEKALKHYAKGKNGERAQRCLKTLPSLPDGMQ